REERSHLRGGQVGIQPGIRTLRKNEATAKIKCAGSGVLLVETSALTTGRHFTAIEIAIPARAFHYVDYSIGNNVLNAVERRIHYDRARPCAGGRFGNARPGAKRPGSLVIVLVAVEHDVDAMVFQQLADGSHLIVPLGRV